MDIITINIITTHNQYGLSNDINILLKNLKLCFYSKFKVSFNFVNFYFNDCPEADINIFIEIVNGMMTNMAKYNILIPNQEWFYKHWKIYLNCFDMILCKSQYSYNIFTEIVKKEKLNTNVKYVSWSSIDRYDKVISKKDYSKILHLCGKSVYKNTQLVIDSWKDTYPELFIVYHPKHVSIKPKLQDNIKYLQTRLDDNRLVQLMNLCGIHICCSSTEGFGHYINEAKSTSSVVITTDYFPMNELIDSSNGFLVKKNGKKNKMPKTLGSKVKFSIEHFQTVIENISKMDVEQLKKFGINARKSYVENEKKHRNLLRNVLTPILSEILKNKKLKNKKKSKKKIKKDKLLAKKSEEENQQTTEDLPYISIVTPTYNRKKLFKMAIYNYKNIYYPKEKFEWVIVDDSDNGQEVEKLLPDNDNIKYVRIKNKLTIGKKRNVCVENCKYPIILFMDDDDYYYPEGVNIRVKALINSKKNCVYSSTIGCFHINKYVSLMNVPPHYLPFNERVSEATLTFKKTFWEEQQFNNKSRGCEAKEFLLGRFSECQEIKSDKILVSLLHSKNTSHKKLITDEPNGCHFGFSDELFLFVTSLDNDED